MAGNRVLIAGVVRPPARFLPPVEMTGVSSDALRHTAIPASAGIQETARATTTRCHSYGNASEWHAGKINDVAPDLIRGPLTGAYGLMAPGSSPDGYGRDDNGGRRRHVPGATRRRP